MRGVVAAACALVIAIVVPPALADEAELAGSTGGGAPGPVVSVDLSKTDVVAGAVVPWTSSCADPAPIGKLVAMPPSGSPDRTTPSLVESPSPLVVPALLDPGSYALVVTCAVDGDGATGEGWTKLTVNAPPPSPSDDAGDDQAGALAASELEAALDPITEPGVPGGIVPGPLHPAPSSPPRTSGAPGEARAATTPGGVAASATNRHFVGTLTVTEATVWDFSGWVDEHGARDITATASVDLEVGAGTTTVVGFTATSVTLTGFMHLLEEIHPSTCDITTTFDLDATGAPFEVTGSLGNLSLGWPDVYEQVDIGPCPGEPQGTNIFHNRWGGACATTDDGSTGTLVYDHTYNPPSGGVGAVTTMTCQGTLTEQVAPTKPIADFTFAKAGNHGADRYKVSFSGTASDPDTDGTPPDIVSYEWDFDDGNGFQTLTASPVKQYTKAGSYQVRLRVTDNDGEQTIVTKAVVLVNKPPEIKYNVQRIGTRIFWVDASASTDDSRIVETGIDFGDPRAFFGSTFSGPIAQYEYGTEGNYTITIRVTDDEGVVSTESVAVSTAGIRVVSVEFPREVQLDARTDAIVTVTNISDVEIQRIRPSFRASRPAALRFEVSRPGNLTLGPGASGVFHVSALGLESGDVFVDFSAFGFDPTSLERVDAAPVRKTVRVTGEPSLAATARRAGEEVSTGTEITGLSDVMRGDVIEYHGTEWDSRGGPIEVMVGDQALARFDAAAAFNGSFEFEGFPLVDTGSEDACTVALHARQDRVDKTLALLTDQGEKILLARGLRLPDGTKVPEDVVACRGWNQGVTSSTGRWDLVTEVITGRVEATEGVVSSRGDGLSFPPGGRWVMRAVDDTVNMEAVPVYGPIRLKRASGDLDIPGTGDQARRMIAWALSQVDTSGGYQFFREEGGPEEWLCEQRIFPSHVRFRLYRGAVRLAPTCPPLVLDGGIMVTLKDFDFPGLSHQGGVVAGMTIVLRGHVRMVAPVATYEDVSADRRWQVVAATDDSVLPGTTVSKRITGFIATQERVIFDVPPGA